jgi:hypothetical protein
LLENRVDSVHTITKGCNSPQSIANLSLKVLTDTALYVQNHG